MKISAGELREIRDRHYRSVTKSAAGEAKNTPLQHFRMANQHLIDHHTARYHRAVVRKRWRRAARHLEHMTRSMRMALRVAQLHG